MADSWEDHVDEGAAPAPAPAPKGLSAGAKAFSFSAGASEWKPSWSAPAAAPAPAPVVAATPPPAPAAEEEGEDAPISAAEIDELKAMLASGDITQEDFDEAMGGGGGDEGGADGEPAAAAVVEKVKEVVIEESDPREHQNLVFIGHVDAGKSTLSGQILFRTGSVDERTIERFQREAKERNRDSWFLAFIMDTDENERAKGKTVEVGRAHFSTDTKRYTILDAPGHKNYVPQMINGAAQADVGLLVISSRKGEFETGFDRGGQTREHAVLAKTLGVEDLIIVVNKMDDPTCNWSEERFEEIKGKMTPFLKDTCGYKVKKRVHWVPISAITGDNVIEGLAAGIAPWYKGLSLLQTLDTLNMSGRDHEGSLRMQVLDRYVERGTVIMGKVDRGTLRIGQTVQLCPTKKKAKIIEIEIQEKNVAMAKTGENVLIKLDKTAPEEVHKGFVLSCPKDPCPAALVLEVNMVLIELLDHRPLFTAGYNCIIHQGTASDECTIARLVTETKRLKGGVEKVVKNPTFVKQGATVTVLISLGMSICCEMYANMPQLGRVTLRDEGKTIAIGMIMGLRKLSEY